MPDVPMPRVRWRDLRRMDNSLLYRIAVWRGWTCAPTTHYAGRCTFHAKRARG